ncbi:MAG: type II secretion system protein [Candidatus Pacebacteria bacterium]|nr:type II secretion system protein [Candidatus Paceibacterota bacterium]
MQNKKGFTLIELLVVIAIIGILSGIVIVSMSGAQNTATDATLKSTLGQLRTTAEIYRYGAGGGYYTGLDADNTEFDTLVDELTDKSGAPSVKVDATTWCVSVQMVSDTSIHSCIDSTGVVKTSATAICSTLTPFKCAD